MIESALHNMEETVKSPCIKVCKYDAEKNCIGCHRSMEEITKWIFYNDDEKRQVLKNTELRKKTPVRGVRDYDYYI